MEPDISTSECIDVEYPASDGQPIGETDFHVREILATLGVLKVLFRDRPDVYIAANNFVYYEKGIPSSVFSPDTYAVFGVPKTERRTYKLWEEGGVPPTVVFEFTSRKTRLEDRGDKKNVCEKLGVAEYFLSDPELDYLRPPLQGYRLVDGKYRPIPADADGFLLSQSLGLKMRHEDGGNLRLYTHAGERLRRMEELDEQIRDSQREIERLKSELERLSKERAR